MSTTPAPDDHDELTVSPTTWGLLRQAAFAGRLALLPAAFVTLLAAWINRPLEGGFAGVVVTLLALGLAGLAWRSLQGARRGLDAGAAALALVLAGGEALQAFGLVGTGVGALGGKEFYVLPLLAWLLLLVGGLALFASLVPGPVAANTRAVPNPFAGRTAPSGAAPEPAAPTSRFAPSAPPTGPSPQAAAWSAPAPSAPAAERPAAGSAPAAGAQAAHAPAAAAQVTPAPAAGRQAPPAAAPATPAGRSDAGPATTDAADAPTAVAPAATTPAAASSAADPGPVPADPADGPGADDADATVVVEAPATAGPGPGGDRSADAPTQQAASPEPGWYPSSDGRTARWWDGDGWTGDRRPLSDFEDR
jgi:hypothetical protein